VSLSNLSCLCVARSGAARRNCSDLGRMGCCDSRAHHSCHIHAMEQSLGEDDDGFAGISPVASFPPNDFGLYDISGNVSVGVRLVPAGLLCGAAAKPRRRHKPASNRQFRSAGTWRSEAHTKRRIVPMHRSILRALHAPVPEEKEIPKQAQTMWAFAVYAQIEPESRFPGTGRVIGKLRFPLVGDKYV